MTVSKQIDSFEREVMEAAGRNVRKLRTDRGIKEEELAKYLNCSERALQSYELGQRRLTLADAARLAVFFRVPMDWLIHGEEARPKRAQITSLEQLKRDRAKPITG